MMQPPGRLMTQAGRSSSTRSAAATGIASTATITPTAGHLQSSNPTDGKILSDVLLSEYAHAYERIPILTASL